MKWELTLYAPSEKKTLVIEAENADEARMLAIQEVQRSDARTFELEILK
ncbi:MAG: hypothetical protein J7L37_00865 [Thermococcus sp.]|nr:hypothetical protein [Thermococcus sp.]